MLFRSLQAATTEIYTLSLHDALPISPLAPSCMCILSVSPLSCPIVAGVRKAQSIHEAGAPTPVQEV